MKEMDCVEVVVEKDKYTKWGVHKGMQGWICDSECIQGCWLVDFPQYGEKDDIAMISIREEDLKKIPGMNAVINEQIKARFDRADMKPESTAGDDMSDYLV